MRSRLGIVLVVGLLLGFAHVMRQRVGTADRRRPCFPGSSKAQVKAGSSHISMTLTAPGGEKFTSHGQMKLGKRRPGHRHGDDRRWRTGGLGTVELRLVDRAFYISLGALTQNKFAKIDLTDKSNPIARQYGDIIENVDPARQVRQYEDAITKFDASGEAVEDRRGRSAAVPDHGRPVEGEPAQAARPGVTARLDHLHPLRRAGRPAPPHGVAHAEPEPGTTRLQLDYTKWGEKVTIAAPEQGQDHRGQPAGPPRPARRSRRPTP